MLSFKDFLQKYSSINKSFLDDFYEIVNENYFNISDQFIVNSNNLQKWLNITSRKDFHETIKRSYKINIDYIITKSNKKGTGKNNEKIYMLTPDCTKMILQQTKSQKGKEVRKYFIEIEKMLYKYKDLIINSLKKELHLMKINLKSKPDNNISKIYVFKALNTDLTLYKLGRTINLKNRLKSYNSNLGNDLEIIYEFETTNIKSVEKCVKSLLKEAQFRKYKEVYEVNLDIIKEAILLCDTNIKLINKKISNNINNNKYYMLIPNENKY